METSINSITAKPRNPMATVMALRNFRLLWLGQGTSLLGDQFYLIAMPWLVMQRTGDPLALGAVLALAGLPRAIFMLLGGALTDRFSPRIIMLASDLVRMALMIGLTALVLVQSMNIWILYAFSLVFGIAAGFFLPAANSIVPQLVGKENLPACNAISQGTGQLTQFIGPVLAGGLIAWAGRGLHLPTRVMAASHGLEGVPLAFAFDAFTFLVSVITLWLMDVPFRPTTTLPEKVLESIWSGLRQFWQDPFIRFVLIMMASGGLLFSGSLMVGVPIMAASHLGGAGAFGIMMSAYAGGSLLGLTAAGALPKPNPARLKGLLIILNLFNSLGWIALIGLKNTVPSAAIMLFIGLGSGYQMIVFFTALQRRVPGHYLGRLMSLVLLFNIGLTPVSQALAGMILRWSLAGLFALTSALFTILIIWASFQPEFRMIGEILTAHQPGD